MSVISFKNVSKNYKLYSKGGLYLRDRMSHVLHRLNPFNGAPSSHIDKRQPLERDFAAIKDVSFDIEQGEAVGFIGRNGAGKSTILKLLASVTRPTLGKVSINGRIAALIEVGAGFHPELTGRENVFLNASILGMKKVEIEMRFDSIVGFAELEDFIDTPVKHYSSGMYVRLGFAIAVHTNPDIFLIDEVLAVGDESFQKKCLETLAAHKAAGKTMILVSHDLAKIEEVCGRVIYVNHGEIRFDGTSHQAIRKYREDLSGAAAGAVPGSHLFGMKAELLNVLVLDSHGNENSTLKPGDDLIVEIRYRAKTRICNPVFGIALYGPNGEHLTGFNTRTCALVIDAIEGEGKMFCRFPKVPLHDGHYSLAASLHDYDGVEVFDYKKTACGFEYGSGNVGQDGLIRLSNRWAWDFECAHPIFPENGVLQQSKKAL